MAKRGYTPEWQRAVIVLATVVVAGVVMAILYLGRSILIPVALAVLLTYVLSPAVAWLHRRGCGRSLSVVLVVGLSILVTVGLGAVVTQEVVSLSKSIPDRRDAIMAKVTATKDWLIGTGDSRLGRLVEDVMDVLNPKPKPVPARPVTKGILVMTSRTSREWSGSKRMSRFVTIPTRTPPSSTTGTPEMR